MVTSISITLLYAAGHFSGLLYHPGVAENIAPVGDPGSDVIVEGIPHKVPTKRLTYFQPLY